MGGKRAPTVQCEGKPSGKKRGEKNQIKKRLETEEQIVTPINKCRDL